MKSKVEEICEISPRDPDTRIYKLRGMMQAYNQDDHALRAQGDVRIFAANSKRGRTMSVQFYQGDPDGGFMITFPASRLDDLFEHMKQK